MIWRVDPGIVQSIDVSAFFVFSDRFPQVEW